MNKLLILNYHSIVDDDDRNIVAEGDIYAINKTEFIEQMEFLKESQIPIVSFHDLENPTIHPFSIAITFDDGNHSDYAIAFPILKKYNFSATFFPTITNINEKNLSWEKLSEISKNGFTIGSHGISHRDLLTISQEEKTIELQSSLEIIEKELKIIVSLFASPFGKINKSLIQNAKENGYKHILTTTFKLNSISSNPFILHRWSIKKSTTIKEFKNVVHRKRILIIFKTINAKFKNTIIAILGTSISNKLNIFIQNRKN